MHSFLYVLFVVVSHGILAVALCCTVGPCGLSLLYMEVSSADPPPTPALLWGPPACPLGESNGTPLQHSRLENLMDGGAWWATVHGVAKSRTRLSDFTFTFPFHALEK